MEVAKSLEADLAEAMKARDEIKVQVLRLLRAAMKNYQIEVRQDLSPQQMLQVLQKEAKKRQDSITQYEAAGRQDLADKERAELKIIDEYLPEQANEEQVRSAVQAAIAEAGQSATMGQVIATVREALNGAVDGSQLAAITREELARNA